MKYINADNFLSGLMKSFINQTENSQDVVTDSKKVIYSIDLPTKKYTYMSPSIVELTGFTMEEINELGFMSLIKDILEPVYSRIDQTLSKNLPEIAEDYSAKYLIITKDGKEKWIEDISILTEDTEGKRTLSIGVLRDVTEFHNSVEELKKEKDKLGSILDLANTIFVVVDEHSKIKLINKKGCSVFGYDKNELINKSIKIILADNRFEQLLSSAPKIFSGETELKFENISTMISKNGDKKIIKWFNNTLEDKNGNIKYIISAGEDITDKVNEERIQDTITKILHASNSEANLNELFNFIRDSISGLMSVKNFYIALYDKKNNYITFPYFIDEYDNDVSPQKLGKGLTEYVLRTGQPALVNKKLDAELIEKGETELIGTSSAIWLGVPLKILNKTIGVLVVQDYENENTYGEKEKEILEFISYPISRAIERRIVETEKNDLIEKLKSLNASKDKLFSLISHDLRSPFNSLLGFSEILNNEFDSLTHEEIREYLKVIFETSKNLYGMTNNLLQFSRFQMDKIEFKPSNLNLRKVVSNSLKLLSGSIIKKNQHVILNIDKSIMVYADKELVNSIIQNILSNAIKFTEKSGEIAINAKLIKFFSKPSDVEISIKDNGIGMSKKDIEKIYNNVMFSSAGTEREYGTGLGLLLVKEFVEENGGKVKIESRLNYGTNFIFSLPVGEKV
ncbi:MAG: PAS domain-containing sensor histidine kinase, partial [Ignavibacteriaceae bacterium]